MTQTTSRRLERGPSAAARAEAAQTLQAPPKAVFIGPAADGVKVLPREVRDEIYRELLVGANVERIKSDEHWLEDGYALGYRFETNILRVSKTVHEEASQILHRENTFIVLSSAEFLLNEAMIDYMVPVVSTNFAAILRFEQHSVAIRLQGCSRVCTCTTCVSKREAGLDKAPERLHLLLAADIDHFVRLCRLLNHLEQRPTFKLVNAVKDAPFRFVEVGNEESRAQRPTTTVVFRDTAYRDAKPDFVAKVLTSLRKAVGSRAVRISGKVDPSMASQAEKTMMPGVVWTYAIGWDLVDVLRELKEVGEKFAIHSKASHAETNCLFIHLYKTIIMDSSNSWIAPPNAETQNTQTYSSVSTRCTSESGSGRCMDWSESINLLSIDSSSAMGAVLMFGGDYGNAEVFFEKAEVAVSEACHVPAETEARYLHLVALLKSRAHNYAEALNDLETAKYLRAEAGLPLHKGLEQDLGRLEKYFETGNPKNSLCICCSSLKHESRAARDTPFLGVKPSGLVGWQDTRHKLTDDDIKAMGVSKEDVPPRTDVEDAVIPLCHARNTTPKTNSSS